MARSTIRFLRQRGQFNTTIEGLVGCDRHTVARVLAEPGELLRRRERPAALEARRRELLSWL